MEEYFDIVDEKNQPTGEIRLRSEAHTLGLWHRTVHVYFFRQTNKQLEFLVHLRSKNVDSAPNNWDTRFGGHLKAGETYEQAAIGEIKDEVGIEVNLSSLINGLARISNKKTNKEFSQVYYYKFTGELGDLSFKDNEVQEVKWLKVDQIILELTENPNNWAPRLEGFLEILEYLTLHLKNKDY
ncbi:MAG: NUDIX domain-containing protein [Candidatus Komeilibacteria bacterium]|nr:NUDIX domain-containing protein [Candidatus Komeilibacteria bacterium]